MEVSNSHKDENPVKFVFSHELLVPIKKKGVGYAQISDCYVVCGIFATITELRDTHCVP